MKNGQKRLAVESRWKKNRLTTKPAKTEGSGKETLQRQSEAKGCPRSSGDSEQIVISIFGQLCR